ncbi:hypothetical protein [Microbacterium aurum]
MTAFDRPRRSGLVWALLGGIVLLGGVIALVVGLLTPNASPSPSPTETSPANSPSASTTPRPVDGAVVDESAVESGWAPEPVTTDAETYVRAALAAASTFDTTLSTRDQWLSYLDTWFTPDTRYPEADRPDRLKAAQLELRQGVVLPQEMWDSLAMQGGRVVANVVGEVDLTDVPEDTTGDMRIGTADVELTFTQQDGTGEESSYTESARVSVQVLCGAGSVPTPGSAQQAGDCKVVRFFTEPVEKLTWAPRPSQSLPSRTRGPAAR